MKAESATASGHNMKLPGYEVSRMAKKAEDEGLLTRPKRGEYCLTQKAKEKLGNA